MKWSEFKTIVDEKLGDIDPKLISIDTSESTYVSKSYSFYLEFDDYNLSLEINSSDKPAIKNLKSHTSSHDWPERISTALVEGLLVHICPKCDQEFYGFKSRKYCYPCAFNGAHTHPDNGKMHGGSYG